MAMVLTKNEREIARNEPKAIETVLSRVAKNRSRPARKRTREAWSRIGRLAIICGTPHLINAR